MAVVAVVTAAIATTVTPAFGLAIAGSGGAPAAHPKVTGSGRPATDARPIPVLASSLTQDGTLLDWRVRLARPFYPLTLAHHHRTLCLLINRPGSSMIASRICVSGHADRGPTLVDERATATSTGPARKLEATVTRSNPRELTASFPVSSFPVTSLHPGHRVGWQVISGISAPACDSAEASTGDCDASFPGRPKPLELHTPQVVGCVPAGPSEVSSGPADQHELALTFDDGPSPDPPAMDFVNLLARAHVPATFFEIGEQIPEYDPTGSIQRAMLADGDMIGDHTWSHPVMTSLSPAAQQSELEETIGAIKQRTGFTPCLWRPPYGDVDPELVSLARSLGLLTVTWDVDPSDWSTPGTPVIYQRVVSGVHDGAIILQHFGGGPRGQTLAALPQEIATLRGEGYRFVTVTQLLGLRLTYQ